MLWIAKPGGYSGRQRDRPPNATVLWRGFFALHETSQMYRIFRKNEWNHFATKSEVNLSGWREAGIISPI